MKVQLSVEITDEQRRALTGSRRLASRDEVRAFLAGAVDGLSEGGKPTDTASSPAPRVPQSTAPARKPSAALEKRLAELKAGGWTEDQLASYRKGWTQV